MDFKHISSGIGGASFPEKYLPRENQEAASLSQTEDTLSLEGRRTPSIKSSFTASMLKETAEAESESLKKVAREILSGPSVHLSVRREKTSHGTPIAPPLVAKDGTIFIFDREGAAVIDGDTMKLRERIELRESGIGSDGSPPVFDDEGKFYYVASNGRTIIGLKEGKEAFNCYATRDISTPLKYKDGTFLYGTIDGRIRLHSQDGELKEEYRIPVIPEPELESQECPTGVHLGSRGIVYAKTADRQLYSFAPDGTQWRRSIGGFAGSGESFSPCESPDGSKMYLEGSRGLIAIDTSTGNEIWRKELPGEPAAPPVLDGEGNLYLYTKEGTIVSLSPEGKILHKWSTGASYARKGGGESRLAIDARGNLCLTPNSGEFHIYTREGGRLMAVKSDELFSDKDHIHDFAFTADGRKAIILAGSDSVAELELPLSPEELLAHQKAQHDSPSSKITEEEDHVNIDGISLPKKSYVLQRGILMLGKNSDLYYFSSNIFSDLQ